MFREDIMYINESLAKGIVKRDLREWRGTDSLQSILGPHRGITTINKRDATVRKTLKKIAPHIFMREIVVPLSTGINLIKQSKSSTEVPGGLSKSELKRRRMAKQKLNQLKRKGDKNTINVFVVKIDEDSEDEDLHVIIMNSDRDMYTDPSASLLGLHSVTCIKKHCLERVVQRMNFTNISDALEEIVSSLPWLLASFNELGQRPDTNYKRSGFKRHIPTENGALLLKSDRSSIEGDQSRMESSMITWIHKNQFKKTQEVTKADFIFAILINEQLSRTDKGEFEDFKNQVITMESSGDVKMVYIDASGQRYPVQEFIQTLEAGEYLDFIVDFER